jgi:hypothetical protein
MLRTQNTDRYLEIVGIRKDDEGYYLCKSGNEIQSSYNLTILSMNSPEKTFLFLNINCLFL